MKVKSGVYKIINIINNKVYIGSATNIKHRKSKHFTTLRTNSHKNKNLQIDFNQYCENNFKFEIIELVEKEKLLEREQYWIDYYQSYNSEYGYNIYRFAGSPRGYKQSDEHIKKRFDSRDGFKHSEISKKLIGEKHKGKKYKMRKSTSYVRDTNTYLRGENHGHAKLKEYEVIEIKKQLLMGYKNKQIAENFNTTEVNVSKIKNNIIWKHVNIDNLFENDSFENINNLDDLKAILVNIINDYVKSIKQCSSIEDINKIISYIYNKMDLMKITMKDFSNIHK